MPIGSVVGCGGQRTQGGVGIINGMCLLPMKQGVEISLAPMMDVTTAHFRRLIRLTSEKTVLFTEMIVSSTVVHMPRDKLKERLGEYDGRTVVQIGGNDALQISEAVKILQGFGYRMFNLNCGCPSSRVKKGSFGAILMLDKELVAEVINRVYDETGAVLSLKVRTGVDDHDGIEFLSGFVGYIRKNTPNRTFYIHARKCWLNGLSPRQNRTVPPLDYETVYMIKELYPDLKIVLNGSITGDNLDKLCNLDGLMVGREAIKNVFVFSDIDEQLGRGVVENGPGSSLDIEVQRIEHDGDEGDQDTRARRMRSVVRQYFEHFPPSEQVKGGHIQPIINLMAGRRGCKAYRRKLGELVAGGVSAGEAYPLIEGFLGDMSRGKNTH